MNLSDEIRNAMNSQGINASDLAKAIGISRASLWRKLNTHTDFTLKEIKKIAKALNIPFLQLMESADGTR